MHTARKHIIDTLRNVMLRCFGGLLISGAAVSCSMMEEELPPCPQGLDLHFKYDYNLERADMFTAHVGGVTVWLFDEGGNLVVKQSQSNTAADSPLKSHDYAMHFDVAPGRYTYLVTGWQKDYEACLREPGAKFRMKEPASGGRPEDLTITLDHVALPDGGIGVPHLGLPLDTLWHGMSAKPVEVILDEVVHDTVSLVRDTKHINVTLRDVDLPSATDIADYEMEIVDHNARLAWDNSVDESIELIYTPYRTWNTEDKTDSRQQTPRSGEETGGSGIGQMAHADFMTSRILWHEQASDDAILTVKNKETGADVIRVNLADMLSRLRVSYDIRRYTPQEFLDRGYDYKITFYLKGDSWAHAYVEVSVGVLSWARRVQFEEL